MMAGTPISSRWTGRVVLLSVLLYFFTVPHTLEDFAYGEPGNAGVPSAVLALVLSIMFGLQALALFWLGQKRRRAIFIHLGIGLFWPISAGAAQLPAILSGAPYRAGIISVLYVGGMMAVGLLLCIACLISFGPASRADQKPD